MTTHQNARKAFRPIDSSLQLAFTLQQVTGRSTQILTRQTVSSPVRHADNQFLRKDTIVCDGKGYLIENVAGLLLMESSFPFTVQIGSAAIQCSGLFAFTGKGESIVIVAEVPTQVSITSIYTVG